MDSLTITLSVILIIGLLLLFMAFLLVTKALNTIQKILAENQNQLKDIARSQRILANNPKDFEETKRIRQIKDKF